jgi:hypothetical protein
VANALLPCRLMLFENGTPRRHRRLMNLQRHVGDLADRLKRKQWNLSISGGCFVFAVARDPVLGQLPEAVILNTGNFLTEESPFVEEWSVDRS